MFDLSTLKLPEPPSLAELDARAKEYFQRIQAAVAPEDRFIGTSLLAWLTHAVNAGLPCVSAYNALSIPRQVIFNSFDKAGADDQRYWDALADLKRRIVDSGQEGKTMLRWDPCAGEDLKEAMSLGLYGDTVPRIELRGYDMRLFDIVYDYPAEMVPILQRPWAKALIVDNYPVEFRVYIEANKIRGISNYYPQRPLTASSKVEIFGTASDPMIFYLRTGQLVEQYSYQLIEHLKQKQRFPWMMSYAQRFDPKTVNATLDFLVQEDGQVLFLEAGPPLGAGAHPCCFIDSKVEGLKLALDPGVELR